MKATDLAYWLQGFFELREDGEGLTARQTKLIEKHLALVFRHEIDPSQGDAKHQAELNEIHSDGEDRVEPSLPTPIISQETLDKIKKEAENAVADHWGPWDPPKIRC